MSNLIHASKYINLKALKYAPHSHGLKSFSQFPDCRYDVLVLVLVNEGITEEFKLKASLHLLTADDVDYFRKEMTTQAYRLERDMGKALSLIGELLNDLKVLKPTPF